MCIIACKPKGQDVPSWDILENCFYNNPDGAGFMYQGAAGKIVIEKGFMSFVAFAERLGELMDQIDLKNVDMVFHFRISTAGGITKGNCHPFPLSGLLQNLKKTLVKADVGIAHNGSINFVYPYLDKTETDTQYFIREYLFDLGYELLKDAAIQRLIADSTKSKFAIMSKEGIVTIGDFIEEDGILYSNDSYQDNFWDYFYAYYYLKDDLKSYKGVKK